MLFDSDILIVSCLCLMICSTMSLTKCYVGLLLFNSTLMKLRVRKREEVQSVRNVNVYGPVVSSGHQILSRTTSMSTNHNTQLHTVLGGGTLVMIVRAASTTNFKKYLHK